LAMAKRSFGVSEPTAFPLALASPASHSLWLGITGLFASGLSRSSAFQFASLNPPGTFEAEDGFQPPVAAEEEDDFQPPETEGSLLLGMPVAPVCASAVFLVDPLGIPLMPPVMPAA